MEELGSFKVGDRVRRKSGPQYAIVRTIEERDGENKVLLYWGTEHSVEFTTWENVEDVVPVDPY